MSLDVYLRCKCCGHEFFEANVTHNLTGMANEAGVYKEVWCPEEVGITKAGQLVEPLKRAITAMKAEPVRFERLNPENGWGTYKGFVPWLENYLRACEENPEALVSASR